MMSEALDATCGSRFAGMESTNQVKLLEPEPQAVRLRTKTRQQGRDKAKLFQEMHPFGPVRPCLSQKVIRNRKTAPGQAQENSGVEPVQCC